jgi:hypothetical protein
VRKIHSAALGLCLSVSGASAQEVPIPAVPIEPGRLSFQQQPAISSNQQLADAVGERLRGNANLRHYRVDVTVNAGQAELTGVVADAAQRDEVVRTVLAAPGIERLRDNLTVQPVSATAPAQLVPVQARVPEGVPPPVGPPPGGMPPEPLPIYQTHPGAPNPSLQPPPLPPYAWPTVAPYNNYSRVAYPQTYPYEAWPFIGPQYPYPKVPLGWRAVTLRWEDGYWWYSRTATGHDWWRIRYW